MVRLPGMIGVSGIGRPNGMLKFTEVLNDLVNYFLLGDILLLEDWKQANHLSDDLAMEFTTNESGDRIFAEGIVIPMTGIENYPAKQRTIGR